MNLLLSMFLLFGAGPYPPQVGSEGSTALAKDDPAFVAWADSVAAVDYGIDVDEMWQVSEKALGPPGDDHFDIAALGRGGVITLGFSSEIANGPSWDFAVFENAIDDFFLELAFVEVSSDGEHFVRFPNDSLTEFPVGAFGHLDPTAIDGLAGKYRLGFGTPFDLDVLIGLPGSEFLDFNHIRFVRLVDIVGDSSSFDSDGDIIFDPYPTIGSAGFDLDAIGVIHVPVADKPFEFIIVDVRLMEGFLEVEWLSEAGQNYRIFSSPDLQLWREVEDVPGSVGRTIWVTLVSEQNQLFIRVEKIEPGS